VPTLSGACQQLHVANTIFTGFSSRNETLVLHIPDAASGFGSRVPHHSSTTTSHRGTIKHESMMIQTPQIQPLNRESNCKTCHPSLAELCQRTAYTHQSPPQNSALRVLQVRKKYTSDLAMSDKPHDQSWDTPCTESLLGINIMLPMNQSRSARQHCACPHFPDYAPMHAFRKSPNGQIHAQLPSTSRQNQTHA
jgi:hypothetical protein